MKPIEFVKQAPTLRYLSRNQMDDIHNGALEILEHTGVQVLHPEALALLRSAGADIDGSLVRIREVLVRKALSTVPSRIVLSERGGGRRLFLEGRNSYFGSGSCCPFTLDPFTGQRRSSVKQDVANAAKAADALPNIDFVMSLNIARNPDPAAGYIHEFDAMLRNTKKPVIVSAYDEKNIRDIIEMAEAAAGGPEALRQNMFLAVYSEATAPLRHAEDALGKTLACAEKNVPIIHTVGQMCGATSPVTLAGALVQANAELLSALVIHQLKNPGAPFFYGGTISVIDMRTFAHAYNAPEFHVASAALTEMGVDYYGIPVFSTGGCTDAKLFDEQASAEAAYSLLLEALSGGNLIHDIGFIDSGLTSSLASMVFCDEMIEMIRHMTSGISWTREDLAMDAIRRVGPGGNFLSDEHTLEHYKEIYYPQLCTRESYDTWKNAGAKRLGEKAEEKVRNILETHKPEPLSAQAAVKIDALIEKFTRKS